MGCVLGFNRARSRRPLDRARPRGSSSGVVRGLFRFGLKNSPRLGRRCFVVPSTLRNPSRRARSKPRANFAPGVRGEVETASALALSHRRWPRKFLPYTAPYSVFPHRIDASSRPTLEPYDTNLRRNNRFTYLVLES